MNPTEKNRAIVTDIMSALAWGDTRPFSEAMADDFTWRTMAVEGPWCGALRGRAEVGEFFAALYRQFAARQATIADRIFADGDTVIVEAKGGGVTTKRGERYANKYCLLFHLENGKLVEVREYLDTAYANTRLDPIPMSPA